VLPPCDSLLVGLLPPTDPTLGDPVPVDRLVPVGVSAGVVPWLGVWLPLPTVT
jgi:hypothetical protein